MSDLRKDIVTTFAGWTALSALRAGSPIKSRERIYPLLREVKFDRLFETPSVKVNEKFFSGWHAAAVAKLRHECPELCVGWAAKLVNVYLKTAVYVGGLGCGFRKI